MCMERFKKGTSSVLIIASNDLLHKDTSAGCN